MWHAQTKANLEEKAPKQRGNGRLDTTTYITLVQMTGEIRLSATETS